MLDSRIIDLSLNKIFLKLVLGEEVPLTIATLKVRSRFLLSLDSCLMSFISLWTLISRILCLNFKGTYRPKTSPRMTRYFFL